MGEYTAQYLKDNLEEINTQLLPWYFSTEDYIKDIIKKYGNVSKKYIVLREFTKNDKNYEKFSESKLPVLYIMDVAKYENETLSLTTNYVHLVTGRGNSVRYYISDKSLEEYLSEIKEKKAKELNEVLVDKIEDILKMDLIDIRERIESARIQYENNSDAEKVQQCELLKKQIHYNFFPVYKTAVKLCDNYESNYHLGKKGFGKLLMNKYVYCEKKPVAKRLMAILKCEKNNKPITEDNISAYTSDEDLNELRNMEMKTFWKKYAKYFTVEQKVTYKVDFIFTDQELSKMADKLSEFNKKDGQLSNDRVSRDKSAYSKWELNNKLYQESLRAVDESLQGNSAKYRLELDISDMSGIKKFLSIRQE